MIPEVANTFAPFVKCHFTLFNLFEIARNIEHSV